MKDFPKIRPQASSLGMDIVSKIIRRAHWIFRPMHDEDDYGIDAHVEVVEDNSPTGKLIGLQIKTGESQFTEQGQNWVHYISEKHKNYWLNHNIPVVLILVDEKSEACYWQIIVDDNLEKTPRNWKIIIPKGNILNTRTLSFFAEYVGENYQADSLRNLFAIHKPIMQAVQNRKVVLLEAEEWVNKSSGRGSLQLTIDGKSELEWEILIGMKSYPEYFGEIFPWADFEEDEEFYEPYDESQSELEYGIGTIRPYEIAGGEVACYRLVLSLNDIGTAYLTIEDFFDTESG